MEASDIRMAGTSVPGFQLNNVCRTYAKFSQQGYRCGKHPLQGMFVSLADNRLSETPTTP